MVMGTLGGGSWGSLRGDLGTPKVIWGPLGRGSAPLKLWGPIWGGYIWGLGGDLGPLRGYGVIWGGWGHLGSWGSLWGDLGTPKVIWGHLGGWGPLGGIWGPLR